MIDKNEMNGGTTFADGKRLQIVLDENGVFKRTEEMGKGVPKASSMDKATQKALSSKEPPVASLPGKTADGENTTGAPQGPGTGFRAGT